jgi:hypothetical protein
MVYLVEQILSKSAADGHWLMNEARIKECVSGALRLF